MRRGRSFDKNSQASSSQSSKIRSISSAPINVQDLAKEIGYKDPSTVKSNNNNDDSEDENKPYVKKAVNVWKARKKEEAKLKRRYQQLCNKYQRVQKKH